MAVLDTSVVNVAIPTMESALNASTHSIQWVLTGYTLVLGILIPISAWMMDKLGPKRLFILSLILFTLGSALCGLSWNLPSIIFFRVIQACGGGFMLPVATAMIYRIFPPERRGMIMGIFGVVIMGAPAIGPLLSGYFVQDASWRLIFYINVPIGIAAAILSFFLMHEFPHSSKSKLDVVGFVTSTVGFFCLLFGFSNVSTDGWSSPKVFLYIVVGVIFLAVFTIQELTVENPMLDLKVLKYPLFSLSVVIASVLYVALFVALFLLPIYLQNEMGYTAIKTGQFLTPAAIASAIVMLIAGRLFNRVGPRLLGGVGLLLLTGATYGFAHLSLDSTSNYIQVMYIIRSLGMGLAMMPVMTAGMNQVPVREIGQASAMSNAIRQVSASLGTAYLTNYWDTKVTEHALHLSSAITPFTPQGLQLSLLQGNFLHQGLSVAQSQLYSSLEVYQQLEAKSFVYGMNDTFFLAALLAAVAFVMVLFMRNRPHQEENTAGASVQAKPEIVIEM